jgi:hypothetical protein
MNRPSLHVCIATGQNLPNLIPALQLGAREVVILETPDMRASARNLKTALEAHDIATTALPFDDSTPERILHSAEEVATRVGERPLVLNATGGHKLITLALTDAMRMADDLHVVYAETRHDRLDWLKPVAEVQPMEDVLGLDDILFAQGYRCVRDGLRDVKLRQDASQRETLTRRMGDESDKVGRFVGTLNVLAGQALALRPQGPFRAQQQLEFPPGGYAAEILREAHRCGLVQWNGAPELVFMSPEAAAYFHGGWLEEYAWLKVRGVKPAAYAVNLTIETVRDKTGNELDVAIAHRNRLLVIECKTARFGRDAAKDSDYIYKLAQLSRQVGGIMSRGLLLSARDVPEEVRARAAEFNIDVLASHEVKRFVAHLRNWMRGDTKAHIS